MNAYNQEISSVEENLSGEEVAEWAEKKKERGVLLRSAASELTKSFKQWWQQGIISFRLRRTEVILELMFLTNSGRNPLN